MLTENDPEFVSVATALYNNARVLMDENRWSEAAECLERSSEITPHHKTLELLGECRLNLQQYLIAVVPLATSTTLNAGVRAPALLSQALLLAGWTQDAKRAAELALQRDPNNRMAKKTIEQVMKIIEGDGNL